MDHISSVAKLFEGANADKPFFLIYKHLFKWIVFPFYYTDLDFTVWSLAYNYI